MADPDPDVERTVAELRELVRRIRSLSPEQRASLLDSIRDDDSAADPPAGSEDTGGPGTARPPSA